MLFKRKEQEIGKFQHGQVNIFNSILPFACDKTLQHVAWKCKWQQKKKNMNIEHRKNNFKQKKKKNNPPKLC